MNDQIDSIAQALHATRSDLASLGQSIKSIVTYATELASTGANHLGAVHDKEAGTASDDLIDCIRARHKDTNFMPGKNFNATDIKKVFDECGTDKGYRHGYEEIYAPIFSLLPAKPKILEIGVGAPESGYAGAPYGSVKAWLSIFPDSLVTGLDIFPADPSYEPPIDRGLTYICADQTSLREMQAISGDLARTRGAIDLIIDDGLHQPHAIIPTVLAFHPLMHAGSFFVIEDVPPSLVDTYLSVFGQLVPGMRWASWKTTAHHDANSHASYIGKSERTGCALVGIKR